MKVLDFGLAKMGGPPSASATTLPPYHDGTQAGVILGTAAYMSPEQAKGKPVDQRADIYAFGVVLYEMVTGMRLHRGDTSTEVLASVIREEPRLDKVPPQLHRLLRRCLEKDPQKRQRHIGDVMALVDDTPAVSPRRSRPAPTLHRTWRWVAAGDRRRGGRGIWGPWRNRPSPRPFGSKSGRRELTFINGGYPMVSPNGKWVVIAAVGGTA